MLLDVGKLLAAPMVLPQWPHQELAICRLGVMAGSEECNEKANYPSLVGSYLALRYKQIKNKCNSFLIYSQKDSTTLRSG